MRFALAFLVALAWLGLLWLVACGPPPEGWGGAGRLYTLPAPVPNNDAGPDGSDDTGIDTFVPPPDTAPPPDTGRG
jgi:hypothetical protein